jgi:hypothetical protein
MRLYFLKHVPVEEQSAYAKSIDSTGARLGVMLFVTDDPGVHACIKVVPRCGMDAYLVYQCALQKQGRLKVGTTEVRHVWYEHMLGAVIDCWGPL